MSHFEAAVLMLIAFAGMAMLAMWGIKRPTMKLESALVDAIDEWMRAPAGDAMQYAHGNAQGIARALAILRSTTFTTEWSAGLDGYQSRVVTGR